MLIPIAHEDAKVRDLPWATFSLMACCLVAFVATSLVRADRVAETRRDLGAAIGYFAEHPYLRPDPKLLPEQTVASLELPAQRHGVRAAAEQGELDRLTGVWLESAAHDPLWQAGLIPAQPRVVGYLGHAFLHSGWLHLLGNMLFLYLSGPFVEERWGRWRYLAFYFGGALLSAAAFSIHFPYLYRPLVGASGAVSAVMAAFLVYFWRNRIRFLFAPLFPLPPYWRFGVRAAVVVPIWYGLNLLGAAVGDQAAPGFGTGTAYDAHIAGFACGLVVALAARVVSRVPEEKPEDTAAVAALAAAHAAVAAGKLDQAELMATHLLRQDPANDGAALLVWSLGRKRGEADEVAGWLEGVIRRELRAGKEAQALAHWRELVAASPRLTVEPVLGLSLLQTLSRQGDHRELERMLQVTLERCPTGAPLGTMLRLLRLAAEQHPVPVAAAALAARVRSHPDLTPEERAELEGLLPSAGAGSRARSWL